jgi:hypothetical protein
VARNIIALGGEVLLVGALVDDAAGDLVAGPLVGDDRMRAASSGRLITPQLRKCVT